jgi:aspartokinase-like uncharacterized kinase
MTERAPPGRVVIKVGGSLFDLPDLGPRLASFLHGYVGAPLLLVPGGGPTAKLLRTLDRIHCLGEEAAHWLALRAMTWNAWLLASLMRNLPTQVVGRLEEWGSCGAGEVISILDAHAFALSDEGRPGALPHNWIVTSDTVAARAALLGRASRLVLLKSVSIPQDTSWDQASERGWVDPFFPRLAEELPRIEAVNLREWRP